MDKLPMQKIVDARPIVFHDVGDAVKSWGRRGMLLGAIFGVIVGITFVAFHSTSDVLTFGTIGTLIVTSVEGAVIAGALGACGAALYAKGVLRGRTTRYDRTLSSYRRTPDIGWRDGDVPLNDFPTKWAYPNSPAQRGPNGARESGNTKA